MLRTFPIFTCFAYHGTLKSISNDFFFQENVQAFYKNKGMLVENLKPWSRPTVAKVTFADIRVITIIGRGQFCISLTNVTNIMVHHFLPFPECIVQKSSQCFYSCWLFATEKVNENLSL